ncbi:metal-dependent amidohydrolase [Formosa agariphila KMM 3901]|uniref:Metal-dependent amidohydrolase n=1 Tax=Formosa agariphila (strain DSM 15362 / KCTC 12365 / LMG 23005 / KMM 3901 / M-2Alg 35-1) TaxID=1347342 RepID=T2KKV2_FORAG|nr:amidohydrolase [Formosa agariphila]CDF79061.1 metal-dependent amidohydrolase [Formosa agariphila KMM 3901]
MKNSLLLILGLILFSCNDNERKHIENKASVYYGGDIITMAGDSPEYVDALVIRDGKIEFAGESSKAMEIAGSGHKMINLEGKTLLPGFIDGHAHFASFSSQAIGAQILPSPDAQADDIPKLIEILKAWNTPENRALTGWIFGMGFDDSVLKEKRFPTKEDLDQVSTETPIMIIHISGHFAALNSKALELLDITANTKDPEGGIIRRLPNTTEPNGVLEELAAIPLYAKALTPASKEALLQFMTAGQEMALSYGYTTAQEGRAMEQHDLLAEFAENNFWKLDVVSYVDYMFTDPLESKWYSQDYTNHYRVGGMKVTLDGSPQGRTAWRTIPYLLPPDGADKNYLGYPAIPNDADVTAIYEKAFANNYQVLTHANGDAAMDQMIRTMKPLAEKYGNDNRRNVLIHGQYVRDDQLDAFKDLNVITSLFPLHTFYWGDWHKEIIGDSLGNRISPVKTALNKGLNISIHTDAPVALPNLMRVVWTAVQRTSRSGQIIGETERLSPFEALKAITIWSAYQHFEEQNKGTLEPGKLADLVILDNNPLKVDPATIKDIQVVETIKEGHTVYRR